MVSNWATYTLNSAAVSIFFSSGKSHKIPLYSRNLKIRVTGLIPSLPESNGTTFRSVRLEGGDDDNDDDDDDDENHIW